MTYPKNLKLDSFLHMALREDIGRRDITTESIIPKSGYLEAVLIVKEKGVLCGMDIARAVFKAQDKNIRFKPLGKDGRNIKRGDVIAKVYGRAASILTAERVALNFLSLLSGIATKTREYVDKVRPYRVKIFDTRKTIPGLRELEKYAVRVGGGFNHRFRLDEMVMIKDNHLKVVGNRLWVIGFKEIRSKILSKTKIEIEVKTLREFKRALKIMPDIIMLDNMNINSIKKAIKIRAALSPNTYHLTPKLEASGGVTLRNIRSIAKTGVEMISVGALTHSIDSIDISLEIQ